MDLKLRQYEQGKAFCDGVVARAGIEGLNRVWSGPEAMPTVAELERPRGLAARAPSRSGCARPPDRTCVLIRTKSGPVYGLVHVRRDAVVLQSRHKPL